MRRELTSPERMPFLTRCGYLSLSKYELKSEVKLCGHLVCLNRYYKTNHKEKYKNLTFYKSTHPGMAQSRPACDFSQNHKKTVNNKSKLMFGGECAPL